MISNKDCIILLNDLANKGIDVTEMKRRAYMNKNVEVEVLEFISKYRPLDIANFYEKLRRQYNKKHSKVYMSIVKEDLSPKEVMITLSSLLTQIMIYANELDNPELFLKHARVNEITKVIELYANDYDLINATNLLHLIKADLKAFESFK